MKKIIILLLSVAFMFSLVACGANRDEELVGRWVFEDDSSFVTTFNEDGSGTHSISWGFGDTFEWSTRRDNLYWNYPGHERMYTPYRISGGALYLTLDDGTVFRYLRD